MVDLGLKFSPSYEGIPPHVSSLDFPLWEAFRRRHASEYVAFYFDVALGRGSDVAGNVSQAVADSWRRLTRLRADVVGDTGVGWDIIELRPNAGPGAIGAVASYVALWFEGPPDQRPVHAILVTDRCSPDIKTVARLQGIEVRCLHESSELAR